MDKTTGRRSIWEQPPAGETPTQPESSPTWGAQTEDVAPAAGWGGPATSSLTSPPAASVVEQLRVAGKTRNRDWESQHPARAFRSVPPNIHAAIRAMAENEDLTMDHVVQALLEFSLVCYQRGEFAIEPVLSNGRRTLFPDEQPSGRQQKRLRWTEKTWGLKPPRKRPGRSRQGQAVRPWKDWPVVAYRLSNDQFHTIIQICQAKSAARGEVLSKLLMYALDAYETGRLVFEAETDIPTGLETWANANQ